MATPPTYHPKRIENQYVVPRVAGCPLRSAQWYLLFCCGAPCRTRHGRISEGRHMSGSESGGRRVRRHGTGSGKVTHTPPAAGRGSARDTHLAVPGSGWEPCWRCGNQLIGAVPQQLAVAPLIILSPLETRCNSPAPDGRCRCLRTPGQNPLEDRLSAPAQPDAETLGFNIKRLCRPMKLLLCRLANCFIYSFSFILVNRGPEKTEGDREAAV